MTLGIRADIDALPVEEKTGLDFSSQNKGVMHACGHDSHIAIGLGAAKILSQNREELNGNIKFIFQPGEETLVGARGMIKDGVLKNPEPDAIIYLHNWPDLETGFIGIKKGLIMAATDKFEIIIKAKGRHGAIPHEAVDPILTASNIVIKLQEIVSRETDPLDTAVISVCTFQAGSVFNIIPDEVKLIGTVRTFDPELREYIAGRIEDIVVGISKAGRCEYDLNYIKGVPPTINDEKLSKKIIEVLIESFGEDKIIQDIWPSMGGEDFSFFQERVPGTYFFLGTRNASPAASSS
jgi:amidohydrolase